jgi:hypothetical protein
MTQNNTLSTSEKGKLRECEAIITKGLKIFVEVGNALLQIRDQRLYRAEFSSFDEYMERRWKWSGSRGHQLIQAAKIVNELRAPDFVRVKALVSNPGGRVELAGYGPGAYMPRTSPVQSGQTSGSGQETSTIVDTATPAGRYIVPIKEYQVRALAKLKTKDERRRAWDAAVAAAGGGDPTAAQVARAVKEIAGTVEEKRVKTRIDVVVDTLDDIGRKLQSFRESRWRLSELKGFFDKQDKLIAEERAKWEAKAEAKAKSS